MANVQARVCQTAHFVESCASRTFCRFSDVEAMREQGLPSAAILNAVVVNGSDVLSPAVFGTKMKPFATRCSMLWVILVWQVCQS